MMRKAIIDVGSNTICIVVYDIEAKDNYKEILHEKFYANIIEYRKKNYLSKNGIAELIAYLSSLVSLCELINCKDISCFATASLRNLENIDEIIDTVKKNTNLEIDILSEKDEAFYDYCCIISSENVPEKGIAFDLGGGSCQLFTFDKKLEDYISLPIGSRRIYRDFVGRNTIIPSKYKAKKIKEYVKQQLVDGGKFNKSGFNTIYAIGGSARAIIKLYRAVFSDKKNKYNNVITVNQLNELLEKIYSLDEKAVSIMCRVIPERVPTIIPAIISIRTICKYTGCKKVQIVNNNIRNGYLQAECLY